MKQLKILIIFTSLLLLLACSERDETAAEDPQRFPWEIRILPNGHNQVFGIELGATTLAQASRALGSHYELALFESRDGALSLEAYFSEVTRHGLSAKIIMGFSRPQEELQGFRQHSIQRKRTESGNIKHLLRADDRAIVSDFAVTDISYIPYVNLDDKMVRKRFGEPAEVLKISASRSHYLYPQKGLDLILDTDGKELLQYVIPARFEQLRKPLLETQAGP